MASRELQPGDCLFEGSCLTVHLLPGDEAAAKEWNEDVAPAKLLAAFEAGDAQLLSPARRMRRERAEPLGKHEGGRVWEWKGPKRGKQIYRALAYNPHGYTMYVAFAAEKKSQDLPSHWIDTARDRITRAISKGYQL